MASYSITLQAPDGTEETFDCNDDQLTKFCTNSRIAENVCNMCTAKPLHFSAAIQDSINKSLATTHANIPTKKFEDR